MKGTCPGLSLKRRASTTSAFLDEIVRLKESLEAAGYGVEMLSGGHTVTWNITPEYSGLRDVGVQAGNYVFSDWLKTPKSRDWRSSNPLLAC